MTGDEPRDKLPESGTRTFETGYGSTPPSIAVIGAIAEIEDVDPVETEFVLHECVDPDALDRLFDEENPGDESDSRIVAVFEVDGYRVTIRNDGTITVEALD